MNNSNLDEKIQEMIDKYHSEIEGMCVSFIKELINSGDIKIHMTRDGAKADLGYIPYRNVSTLENRLEKCHKIIEILSDHLGRDKFLELVGEYYD